MEPEVMVMGFTVYPGDLLHHSLGQRFSEAGLFIDWQGVFHLSGLLCYCGRACYTSLHFYIQT